MKLFYVFVVANIILLQNFVISDPPMCLYINDIYTCHESCKTCNQCGDRKSCTSCRKDEFKISATYNDEIFECAPNCETHSKDIHGKDYFYCSSSKKVTADKFTETSEPRNLNVIQTNSFNIDTNVILIILVSVLILILLCFGSIALMCYCYYIFKERLSPPPTIRTTDLEANVAKRASTEPLIAQRFFNNAVVYNTLEILHTDNYELGDVIGGGNYSRVFEGTLNGEQVAIKMALREGRKSIHKELQIYDKVTHPNILPALGVHLAVENLLFMPLRKFNLADYFIDYGVTIQVDRLLRYCIQISNAVKYLHEKEILHCDLKIDNILVKDDEGEQVEISDFGCAIDLSHDREARYNGTITHTAYELVKDYVNPEIKPKGTKASDVWAFAVTAWQIFSKSGRIPHDFISPREIINNYERGKKLPKPREMPDRLWRYIILRCFDLQPQSRFTMKEIYDHLTTETF